MAYLSHSPVREFQFGAAIASRIAPGLIVKSALVAVAAAGAILALTEFSSAPEAAVASAKGDRLVAPISAGVAATDVGFVNDPATRTTSVAKGAETPLSAGAPMADH